MLRIGTSEKILAHSEGQKSPRSVPLVLTTNLENAAAQNAWASLIFLGIGSADLRLHIRIVGAHLIHERRQLTPTSQLALSLEQLF